MIKVLETHFQGSERGIVSDEELLAFYRDKEGKKFYRNYFLLVAIGKSLTDPLHDFQMWQCQRKDGRNLILAGWSAERRRGLEHLADDLAKASLSYCIIGPESP